MILDSLITGFITKNAELILKHLDPHLEAEGDLEKYKSIITAWLNIDDSEHLVLNTNSNIFASYYRGGRSTSMSLFKNGLVSENSNSYRVYNVPRVKYKIEHDILYKTTSLGFLAKTSGEIIPFWRKEFEKVISLDGTL